jgi:hypothetical protein
VAPGAEQHVPLRDGKVAVVVPLGGGESRLSLALIEPLATKSADALLVDLQWGFEAAAP